MNKNKLWHYFINLILFLTVFTVIKILLIKISLKFIIKGVKPIIFIVLTLIYVAQAKILISLRLATPMGFEPTTFNVTDWRSSLLNYGAIWACNPRQDWFFLPYLWIRVGKSRQKLRIVVTPRRFELRLPDWRSGLLDRLEDGAIYWRVLD